MTLSPTAVDAEEQTEDSEALLLEPCQILKSEAQHDPQQRPRRRRQVLRLLIRAACDGDRDLLKMILREPWVPVDVSIDEFGWTPLIYAACYGHVEIARMLLDAGATIDYQDKKGWTALLWAASRRDETMIRFLIDRGASCRIPSLAGYTLYRDKALRHLFPDQTIQSLYRFDWDHCRPDQMFVFGQDDVAHIVDTLVDEKAPLSSQDDPWAPANVLFLCCRFAHYHARRELGQELLTSAMARIAKTIRANARSIHHLAFWISNLYQLLVYFKRDTHLAAGTTAADHRSIHSLLGETFDSHLVSYVERQLERLVEPSMLEFCEESDCDMLATPVTYADDSSWQQRMMIMRGGSAFRRNSAPTITPPSTLINAITSTLDILKMYRVHPDILRQLTQCSLAFCSATIFDTILANKKYLSRSRAILIRMNVSSLEEWARTQDQQQPLLLFRPVAQLLQFLQSISQLHDFNVFQDTVRQFDCLTPAQIRHCISNYRYEVGEPRLPATTAPRVSEDNHPSPAAKAAGWRPAFPFVVPPIHLVSTSKLGSPYPSIPDQWMARLDRRK
ncbi:hypothetical protein BX666DRAFT_1855924 [Dichotomocladium elegans]|nr:hypothetical protein BX666DRAFT_1855924 [Dichotomocladium elegans]